MIKPDDAYCHDCGEEATYMDLKEEPSLYKIGAMCGDCDRDYGIVECVPWTDVDHRDEVWETAETAVQDYLSCNSWREIEFSSPISLW